MDDFKGFPDKVKYNIENLNKGAYVGGQGAPLLLHSGGTSLMTSHWARGAPNPPTHSSITVFS